MKTILLAAGAVAAALTAGQALAAVRHHAGASAAMAGPKQPIPYAELSAYLKASPKQRASKDWWSEAQASTGAAANTSATTAAPSANAGAATPTTPPSLGGGTITPSAAPPLPATPPVNTPSTTDAAPPPTAATPAAPVNPPPK